MMDLFETTGYGRLNFSSFAVWMNLDPAFSGPHCSWLPPAVWRSFHFPVGDEHSKPVAGMADPDVELPITALSSYAHEARHFHDLLVSSYGSMLARQYTRISLIYLFCWHELLLREQPLFVPFHKWINEGRYYKHGSPGLQEAGPNVRTLVAEYRSMEEKLATFDQGSIVEEQKDARLTSRSILEGLATIAQEQSIRNDFGDRMVDAFRSGFKTKSAFKTYYGARDFLGDKIGCSEVPEIASLLLLASLFGDFSDPDPRRLRSPADILTRLAEWLRSNHYDLNTDVDSVVAVKQVNQYFEQRHGGNLFAMFERATKANERVYAAFKQMIARYEEACNEPSTRARDVLRRFQNFCEVRKEFGEHVIADPRRYCGKDYIREQRNLPPPVLFIESELGIPEAQRLEGLYYIQNETRHRLQNLVNVNPQIQSIATTDGFIRRAHVISPRYSASSDASIPQIDIELWQRCNDITASINFFMNGVKNQQGKQLTPNYLVRDIVTGLNALGIRVYDWRGEINPKSPEYRGHSVGA
jgi:hypothetical protein